MNFCLEHYDNFGTEIIFWLEVDGFDNQEIIQKAKEIDGKECYDSSCFGCCVMLDDKGWNIIYENNDGRCELYYVDNEGYKNWFDYQFDKLEREEIIKCCMENLTSIIK